MDPQREGLVLVLELGLGLALRIGWLQAIFFTLPLRLAMLVAMQSDRLRLSSKMQRQVK